MNRIMTAKMLRFAGCAALLALLVVSSSAGRETNSIPSVPVMVEIMPQQALAARTIGQTRERLKAQRDEALALLQSVLDDPHAGEAQKSQALAQKTQIASRMETEAAVEALLDEMGFGEMAVVAGEGALHIIAPWQTAENEQNRVRMIDAAVSQSGLSPEAVKIILAKK